ncbi:MAG: CvpA family protein [Caulobacteraceae bacterium]
MTTFDIIAVLILLVSAAVGWVRGATREVTTVVSLILAVLIAAYGLRYTGGFFRKAVDPDWLGNVAAIAVVFIIAYIALRLLSAALTKGVHSTQALGTLDRVVGVGFGLVRALVLLGVFYLVFNAATPPDRVPRWIRNAAFYPLSGFAAKTMMAFAPKGALAAGKVAPVIERAVKEGAKDKPDVAAPDLTPEPTPSNRAVEASR